MPRTFIQINLHDVQPVIRAAADGLCMDIALNPLHGPDFIAIYFDVKAARETGEALMREAYRVEQMEKLKAADMADAPMPSLADA